MTSLLAPGQEQHVRLRVDRFGPGAVGLLLPRVAAAAPGSTVEVDLRDMEDVHVTPGWVVALVQAARLVRRGGGTLVVLTPPVLLGRVLVRLRLTVLALRS